MTEIPRAVRAKARRIVEDYANAEETRNVRLCALRDEYRLQQKEVVALTGYTRETVRVALMTPEQRAQYKEERRLKNAPAPPP